MFSLIVTILAIVLAVALAVAALWFGGSVFGEGAAQARDAKNAAQANQIAGAVAAYRTDLIAEPTSLEDLVDEGYLASIPEGAWEVDGQYVIRQLDTEDECQAFNYKFNIDDVPACTDARYQGQIVCCIDAQ